MRLYCDNIEKFINKVNHFYTVTEEEFRAKDIEKGKVVTLYSQYKECDFNIKLIVHYKDYHVLYLVKIENSEYNREVVSNYYYGTNPND